LLKVISRVSKFNIKSKWHSLIRRLAGPLEPTVAFDKLAMQYKDRSKGTGYHTPFFKSLGATRILNMDVAIEMQKIAKADYPEIETLCFEEQHLPDLKGSFDIVFCILSLGYINDLKKVMSYWNQHLCEEGIIYLMDLNHSYGRNQKRQFSIDGKLYKVKHTCYEPQSVLSMAKELDLEAEFTEFFVSEKHRELFPSNKSYSALKDTPILDCYLIKRHS